MEHLNNPFVTIGIAIVGFITSLVSLIKNRNKKPEQISSDKEAYNAEKAKNEITAEIQKLIKSSEIDFSPLNKLLKGSNLETAGTIKKEFTLLHMRTFCLEKGYEFNEENILKEIEDQIAFTKVVNAK